MQLYCSIRGVSACLGVEKGLGNMVVVVEVEENGGAAGVAFKGIELPIRLVLHEVKAQLPARLGLLAEVPHPVPDLHVH